MHDLDEAEYHADTTSLSVSGAKTLLRSPARFHYERTHPREQKAAFDFGHAAHKLVLGVGAPLVVVDADDWRTKAAREARDAAYTDGAVPLLKADHAKVVEMADALSSHTLAMQLLSDGQPEVSAYAIDEATGVTRRGRFDWLHPSLLVDYKTTVDSHPEALAGRYGAMSKWGYDMQASWYTDLARDCGHPAEAFAFIVQEKAAPYDVTVAIIEDFDLEPARARNRRALEIFAECTATGVWPGPVPATSVARLSLTQPTYTLEDMS